MPETKTIRPAYGQLTDEQIVEQLGAFFLLRMAAGASSTTDALQCARFVLELRGIKVNSSGRRVAVSPPVLIEPDE